MAEDVRDLPDPIAPDSATRNVAFAFGFRMVGAAFTAALTLVLVRKLGPDDYGVFTLAMSVGVLVVFLADFGMARSAGRFIAENRSDRRAARSVYRDALGLKVAAAAIASILLFLAAEPIASAYGIESLDWPLRVMAISVFGQSMLMLAFSTFEAVGRVSLTLRLAFTESVVETGASITLVLLGAGVVGATVGRAAGYVLASALGVLLAFRLMRGRGGERIVANASRSRILRYAAALAVVDAAFTLFDRLDVLLIGAYLDAEAVGVFEAPLKLIVLLGYFAGALSGGVSPGLARNVRGPAEIFRFLFALRVLIIFQAAVIVPALVWAEPIVDLLLGDAYAESIPILRALTPFMFLFGIASLVTISVNYVGRARQRIPIAIAALLINVLIDIILIPEIGPIAGAVGSGAAFCVYVPAHVLVLREELGFSLRPILRTTARSLLSAGVMAAVLYAFGTEELSVFEWIAGGAAATAAYLLALVVIREVTPGEVRFLRRRGASVLRQIRRG